MGNFHEEYARLRRLIRRTLQLAVPGIAAQYPQLKINSS
jgi:hypothetical protein